MPRRRAIIDFIRLAVVHDSTGMGTNVPSIRYTRITTCDAATEDVTISWR
jgi:hypothetical protein